MMRNDKIILKLRKFMEKRLSKKDTDTDMKLTSI